MPESTRSRPSTLYAEVGKNISRLRKDIAMSQAELAARVEMTQPLVAAIEGGNRRISLEDLLKVCNVLHASLEDLLPSQQEGPRKPGPRPKLAVAYEKLTKLPEKEQNAVLVMIDSLANATTKD